MKIFTQTLAGLKKSCTFATHLRNKPTAKAKRLIKNAQMAELVDALVNSRYNKVLAARTLGISRSKLYRKLREHGLLAKFEAQ